MLQISNSWLPPTALKIFRGAAGLYRGEFLDGFHLADPVFDRWLAGERKRLRSMVENVLERLIGYQSGADTVATAQRLLALRLTAL